MDDSEGATGSRNQHTRNLKEKLIKGLSIKRCRRDTILMWPPRDQDLQRAYSEYDVLMDDHSIHQHVNMKKCSTCWTCLLPRFTENLLVYQCGTVSKEDSAQVWSQYWIFVEYNNIEKQFRKLERGDKKRIAHHNTLVSMFNEYAEEDRKILDGEVSGERTHSMKRTYNRYLSETREALRSYL